MIDPESKRYMAWIKKYAKSDRQWLAFKVQALNGLLEFFAKPKQELLEIILEKQLKGAEEHGSPIYTQDTIKRELEAEYTDILGWGLIGEWNKQKKQKP